MPKKNLPPYELTPEARARLVPHHEKWLKIATNTDAMTEADREIMRGAVEGLYRAAKLKPPPRDRIVFVPSPLVAALAGGFAAAIWHLRKDEAFAKSIGAVNPSARGAIAPSATEAATRAATEAATE